MTELRQRQPRIAEPKYLAWLRKQPCACGCGSAPPSDAAHLRAGSIKYGKEISGMGIKPHDCWAMPLKHSHHMAQHAFGDEVLWWNQHGINPFERAMRYYAAWFSQEASKPADAPSRKRATKAKVRPKPIGGRGWPKKQAKLQNRGFSKVKRGFRT